jgi:DNA phosphorothioation-dependent restriction protein DptH
MQIIGILEKTISNALESALKVRPDSKVRMVLRGLPGNILGTLLVNYESTGGVHVSNHDPIRVLLVSAEADVVGLRNVKQTILVLSPNGEHLDNSTGSSVEFIGLDPETVNGKQDFSEDPFIDGLLVQLQERLSYDPDDREKIRKSLNYSFADRARRGDVDRTTTALNECWKLLGDLFEVTDDFNLFLARSGLPSLKNGDLGTSEHLDLLGNLAKFIESNGFSFAMETLLGEADESLHPHIESFFDSLSAKRCDSPSDFTLSPAYFYSQDNIPAGWWEALDLETWVNLLQSIKPAKKEGLRIECLNPITPHKVNGLPFVVQDAPHFRVIADGINKPDKIKIYRGQGQNPVEEATINVDEDWRPDDVPVHGNSVNYRFVAGEGYKPTNVKVISLEEYEPGIIVSCVSAKKITPPKKRNTRAGDNAIIWECDVELVTAGTFQIELLLSSHTTITNEAITDDATSENIKQSVEIGDPSNLRRIFYAETDEETTYRIKVSDSRLGEFEFHIHFHSEGEEPTGVSSVFEALVMDNLQGKSTASSVEIPWGYRIYDLEKFLLEDPHACYPLIISGDYLSSLSKRPNWKNRPIMSGYMCENDIRPNFEDWNVPEGYIQARSDILEYIRKKIPGNEKLIELFRFDQNMREDSFRELVSRYLQEYEDWLRDDYESAILSDAYMVIPPERQMLGLSSYPEAVLMTPLHPLRFAWHCIAHSVLAETAYEGVRCPAAGIINPHAVPDMLHLPCIQPGGRRELVPFVSIRSSSPYWGVLWNGRCLDDLNDSPSSGLWGGDWGVSIEGASNGFNKAQVKKAISDVREIRTAKNLVSVAITSYTGGSSSCNEGIIEWCQDNLGSAEKDDWAPAGARRMDILDMRKKEALSPSSAIIADMTNKTNASVRWFRTQEKMKCDLSIIENLGQHQPRLDSGSARSPIGWGGLIRSRIRRHIEGSSGSKFIEESRAGRYYSGTGEGDGLAGKVGIIMSIMESEPTINKGAPDSYIFTPCLDNIVTSLEQSAYCALSSSVIDSSCFFGQHGGNYLWDYELPNYSSVSGERNGFYLLVRENPTLISAIRSAIDELCIPSSQGLSDDDIHRVLVEIARRGMPTLKRISDGGAAALGEFGAFVALRLLQDSFVEGTKHGCIIPARHVSDDGTTTVNLIIPIDPFQAPMDSLRKASEGSGTSLKRPDLIVFSIALDNVDDPVSIKITPIEVKARSSEFSKADMLAAIEQTKAFSSYFSKRLFPETGQQTDRLWDLAIKEFLSSLISFGFRVYGLLDDFNNDSKEWSVLHEKVVGGLFAGTLSMEVDATGRLVVVDKSKVSQSRDADNDGFGEVIVLTATDALDIFKNTSDTMIYNIKNTVKNWNLLASSLPFEEQPEILVDECTTTTEPIVMPQPAKQKEEEKKENEPYEDDKSKHGAGVDLGGEAKDGSYDKPEGDGVRFSVGQTINGFTAAHRDFWPSNTKLTHLNTGIVGDLGTGKTQLIKALIYQIVAHPENNRGHKPRFLIFDYKDDYSSKDFVEATGAKVVDPFELPLNMFDVTNCTARKPWMERYKFFSDVLSKIYGGIGQVQQLNIKNAVRQAYQKASEQGMPAPLLEQVLSEYIDVTNGKADSPMNILSDLVDMEIFATSRDKIMPFEEFMDGVVVINLKSLGQDDNTKNLLVVILLNFFYEYMLKLKKKPFHGDDPQLRFINSMLLVDEADSIMKYEFDVLRKVLLQGREFGVGVLLSSQYLSHFRRQENNYLENLLTWFIHNVSNVNVRELESIGITKADNEMLTQIRSLEKHECLFKTLDVNGDFVRAIPFYKLIID